MHGPSTGTCVYIAPMLCKAYKLLDKLTFMPSYPHALMPSSCTGFSGCMLRAHVACMQEMHITMDTVSPHNIIPFVP